MKSIMIRGVIFDLDGVLVHTDELHFRAWSCIAEELGIPFDRDANDRLRGVSRAESLERLLAIKPEVRLGDKEKAALCERKNSLYQASLETLTAADIPPAVRAVLEILRKRKLRLAVGSSSRNARLILQRTELEQAFDAVTDGTMITASKPDPEVSCVRRHCSGWSRMSAPWLRTPRLAFLPHTGRGCMPSGWAPAQPATASDPTSCSLI